MAATTLDVLRYMNDFGLVHRDVKVCTKGHQDSASLSQIFYKPVLGKWDQWIGTSGSALCTLDDSATLGILTSVPCVLPLDCVAGTAERK